MKKITIASHIRYLPSDLVKTSTLAKTLCGHLKEGIHTVQMDLEFFKSWPTQKSSSDVYTQCRSLTLSHFMRNTIYSMPIYYNVIHLNTYLSLQCPSAEGRHKLFMTSFREQVTWHASLTLLFNKALSHSTIRSICANILPMSTQPLQRKCAPALHHPVSMNNGSSVAKDSPLALSYYVALNNYLPIFIDVIHLSLIIVCTTHTHTCT